ncbi:Gfo/Idh/MocA family protein [Sphingobacterium lactis]|uniref:Tat (Twin-arginine translocation) pathway signal sequence n=1 Tax=Sphingobacterium lactis TaxID=797291 RepID=A0A1H6CNK9_9SPHI|nr:Gfo/Idh/MocA family oxidoreductase [Sphingobacterium lactis]SEG74508.1 Tat (twin-arginine translocation) pathway signal sequence [Sphingobacterium lactis]
MNRRDFIGKTALGAAAITILPRHVLGGNGFLAPSDRINLGYIGVGKQVPVLLHGLMGVPETMVIAAADVNSQKLSHFIGEANKLNAKKSGHEVQGYGDYRELLGRKDIDAVVIASPDHWHAMHVVDAAKAGKDIYCEKPLALTIDEGRAMVDAVRKYKRVLQTGSMQRSQHYFRQAADLIRNGYIGDIKEVNVSIGEPVRECDLPSLPTPAHIDWDSWIGPSLYRGFSPVLSPELNSKEWALWRLYHGFGGGYITDWGAHMFDIVQWALDMDSSGPVSFTPPDVPNAKEGLYFTYKNGVKVNHKSWGSFNAIQFLGTEGKIEVAREFLRSDKANLPEMKIAEKDRKVYYSENHYKDFTDAIKKRSKPICDVEVGHRTATVCNAVNIAYQLQKPIKWDPRKEQFDNPFANNLKGRPYRGKWNYLDF